MVEDEGLAPSIAATTAQRQASIAELAASGTFASIGGDADWRAFADRALERLRRVDEAPL